MTLDAVDNEDNGGTNRRIYISREDAESRRVSNESELFWRIERSGFEKCIPSERTIEEQARSFSNAELIVGPHGAGLANMVYADRATVIELYGADLVQGRFFLLLANELGHRYYNLECRTDGHDLVVSSDDLVAVLDGLCESR